VASTEKPSSPEGVRFPLHEPLPPELSVAAGLEAYLAENGFDRALYDAAWTPASLFGIPVPVPNTPKHRFAIMRHDLHHVATGFGTDPVGEAEISAWEARRGFGRIGLYTTGIVSGLVLLGLVLSPKRTIVALRGGRSSKGNLFASDVPYETLLSWTVGELRSHLGLPDRGLAGGRTLHEKAPVRGDSVT
jgi:hypothetical protein